MKQELTEVIECSQFDYLREDKQKLIGIQGIKIIKVDLKNEKPRLGFYWKDKETGKIIKSNYDTSD